MSFFEWSDSYLVGDDKIDFQHRNLVNMLNNLHDATLLEPTAAKVAVGVFLENLVEYTVFHFATEEQLMRETRYPDSEQHTFEHESLKKRVIDYIHLFEKDDLDFEVLMNFLKEWLIQHIGKSDNKLSNFLHPLS